MSDSFQIRLRHLSSDVCAARAQDALGAVEGISDAVVSLEGESAQFTAASAKALKNAFAALEAAGFPVELGGDDGAHRAQRENAATALRRTTLLAVLLALPVLILETGSHLFPPMAQAIEGSIGTQTSWQLQSVFAAIVLFGPGWRFLRDGIPALIRLRPDLNSLVVLSAGAAYLYSAVVLAAPDLLPVGAAYFDTACIPVVLVLFARWREARATERANAAIPPPASDDTSRRDYQSLADRMAPRLMVIVLTVAASAAMVWVLAGAGPGPAFALGAGLSVLILACPYAAGLATSLPTAITMDRAARQGTCFRTGLALQQLPRVSLVVFDADAWVIAGPRAVENLKSRGLRVGIMGTQGAAALEPLARELGIETCLADVPPGEKAAALETLRGTGEVIAFVARSHTGLPSLAPRDIGIVLDGGAQGTADVIIKEEDGGRLSDAISLAEYATRNIRQNLVCAFGVNLALMPVAAGALYPVTGLWMSPPLAAGAMGLSCLLVLLNALRLRRA